MRVLVLESAARTHVGRRARNEDAVFATSRLVAVADGVGGHAAGEVASQAAIDVLAYMRARDNVSVIVADVVATDRPPSTWSPRRIQPQ